MDNKPIYTILKETIEASSVGEVYTMLHNVVSDLGRIKELEDKIEECKDWKWDKYE